ncbi:glutamate--tRNA ligase [Alkalibacter mobilis]|uniref:glutamate--tRNA ligase n=1 Tax=Alkalibacter mobilis TaxID=2787712 RepID=UPI00189D589F|nr:glutamate--tRNA ligase [Alkalibacter mobilis]MBF7096513.1 glutamate--tRNA ligase [Alkalibacter mobilis]
MTRVRFAPSPTGYVHIGSLRTALYNYLFAKKNNGSYILRIEDTDQKRLIEDSMVNLIKCLETTGIVHDEGPTFEGEKLIQKGEYGPYIQSERLDIYKDHIQRLIDEGHAYHCFCSRERLEELREEQRKANQTPKYDGHCRTLTSEQVKERIANGEDYVIRLKMPENHNISFYDEVRGEICINSDEVDDQVLVKSDGFPTYHFAVVIDDHLMKITHVIRGEEWLPSTPKHVLLYEAFGWEKPVYVHLPNILNPDKKKLSKRQGDVAVEDFLAKGYLPEALINYIALLGWSPDVNEEIFSMEELVEHFDIKRVNKSGAVFDVNKLNWMNGEYIRKMTLEDATKSALPFMLETGYVTKADEIERFEYLVRIVDTFIEKMDKFSDIKDEMKSIFEYNLENSEEVTEMLNLDSTPVLAKAAVEKMSELEDFSPENLKSLFKEIQKEYGIKGKNLFMPARIIATGSMHGSDLMKIMSILGKDETIKRFSSYNR